MPTTSQIRFLTLFRPGVGGEGGVGVRGRILPVASLDNIEANATKLCDSFSKNYLDGHDFQNFDFSYFKIKKGFLVVFRSFYCFVHSF